MKLHEAVNKNFADIKEILIFLEVRTDLQQKSLDNITKILEKSEQVHRDNTKLIKFLQDRVTTLEKR